MDETIISTRSNRRPHGRPRARQAPVRRWQSGVLAVAMLVGPAVAVAGATPAAGSAVEAGGASGFSRAVEVSSPANASRDAHGWLLGVSCTSSGDCTSVGEYDDSSGHQQAMAAAETGGKWSRASEVSSPASSASNPEASLSSVSCTSPGNCTAVGSYTNSAGSQEAMVATERDGKWGRAGELGLPAGADPSRPNAALHGLSCTSQGDCAAVGAYGTSAGAVDAMVVAETGGKWGRAVELGLPVNAGTGTTASATLFGVSCASTGDCTAVGLYSETSHSRQAIVATEARGRWAPAAAFDLLPSGASGTWSSLFGVWCTSLGHCAAVGSYIGGSGSEEAMVATEAGGTWGPAAEPSLPAGANSSYPNAELEAVSCSSQGNCAAFGAYSTTASYSLDMVAVETGGKWARAADLNPPSGHGTSTILGGSGNSVACSAKGFCTAVGSYGPQAMAAAGTV